MERTIFIVSTRADEIREHVVCVRRADELAHKTHELPDLAFVGQRSRDAERIRSGVDLDRDGIIRAGELQELDLPGKRTRGLPVLAVGVRQEQRLGNGRTEQKLN